MTARCETPFLRLPRNERGRDLVVGDIHGCLDLVLRAMDRMKFDPAVDRLFSVGDLIDRGPDSARSARFVREPFLKGIRGNHEDMVLELYQDGAPHEAAIAFMASRNGFDWWLHASDETRADVLEAIRPLPIAIETETARGSVGFVHAEVPKGMHWQDFVQDLEASVDRTMQIALWERSRLRAGDDSGVPGIGRLFVGHTPVPQPMRLGNVYAVDTGAVYGVLGREVDGALTLADILTQTSVLSGAEAPLTPKELIFTVPNDRPTDRPFSKPRSEAEPRAAPRPAPPRPAASSPERRSVPAVAVAPPPEYRKETRVGVLAADPAVIGGKTPGVQGEIQEDGGACVAYVAWGAPAKALLQMKAGQRVQMTGGRFPKDPGRLKVFDARSIGRGPKPELVITIR